jgi:hypothetical protein
MPKRRRSTLRTMSNRATPAVHRSGAPLHAAKQAAGAPSAGSQFFNRPSRDPADGATLGSLPPGGDSEGRRPGTPCHAIHPRRPERASETDSTSLRVTLSGAASEAAQSKGPPMERSAPLREARLLICGDLSTRSRTLSLKMTREDDPEGGAGAQGRHTQRPDQATNKSSPARTSSA